MSETVETKVEETKTEVVEVKNPFADDSWTDSTAPKEEVVVEQKVEEPIVEKKEETITTNKAEEEYVDPNEWLKREFGFDDVASAKVQIEELRKLKETAQTPAEIKFANDESKRYYEAIAAGKEDEIFEIIATKRQFDKAEKLDVNDPKQAAELLKLSYQLKHKDLDQREILDLFDEQYEKMQKPKQLLDQTDEEYAELCEKVDARNAAIDRKIIRDAKMAKPDVLKLKSELVLPDIPKKTEAPVAATRPQEELEAEQKAIEGFQKTIAPSLQSFEGFTAAVKDKDVEIPLSYGLTQEQKAIVDGQLKAFTESGLNANAIFAQRWLNEDGSINTGKMVRDLSLLNNESEITTKMVNDAANKRLELYLKEKKQININETKQTNTYSPEHDGKPEMEKVQDFFWNQS